MVFLLNSIGIPLEIIDFLDFLCKAMALGDSEPGRDISQRIQRKSLRFGLCGISMLSTDIPISTRVEFGISVETMEIPQSPKWSDFL